jgi:hypothetical protein
VSDVTGRLLGETLHRVGEVAVVEYRKVMGLPLPSPGDRLPAPAVVPFNPEIRDDTAVIRSLGLDFSKTLALGFDVDQMAPVAAGDVLRAETRLSRDDRGDGARLVDIETTFFHDDVPVRRWTLHLIERKGGAT